MVLALSITATWAVRLAAVAAFVFVVTAVLPVLVLRNRPHRTWFQRSLLSLNVSLVVVALTSASVLTWFDDEFAEIPRQEFGTDVLAEAEEATDPRNFLLVGIDQAEGLDPDDPVNAGRSPGSRLADTIMVLRVVPETREAHLISFPRDLYVPIAGTGRTDRINTTLQVGGPETLIQTLWETYQIPIHHYVEVNFLGFRELVSVLGGVPMYFPNSVKDDTSGLRVEVPEGGACVTLDPVQALAFVRSRRSYQEFIDGRWVLDPSADLGRMRRQQLFMQLALAQAVDKGIRNPSTLQQFIEVGQTHVVLDEDVPIGDLIDLGSRFSDFDPTALHTYQLPVTGGSAGAASVLFLDETAAQDELNPFRGVSNEILTPRAVRVNVRNGSGAAGQATEVSEALSNVKPLGFTVVSAYDADSWDYERTLIRYTPGNATFAAFLARYLDRDPVLEEVDDLGEAQVELVTGMDFTSIRADARPEDAVADLIPRSTTTSTTEPDPDSTETTATTEPRPTTTIGLVPAQPPDEEC
jgi:polyisoprenyl-teichoic acid--peptidoglycan teichoic acid transferase